MLSNAGKDCSEKGDEDHPDEESSIRRNIFNALFGEDGGDSGEQCGEESPDACVHALIVAGKLNFMRQLVWRNACKTVSMIKEIVVIEILCNVLAAFEKTRKSSASTYIPMTLTTTLFRRWPSNSA